MKIFFYFYLILITSTLLTSCNKISNDSTNISLIKISTVYPRYFEKSGKGWIPISINYLPEKNMENVESYFRKFSENGGNSMRIWISTAYLEIEDSVEGEYSEEKFKRIDNILELAERYDIQIKFTLQHIRTISDVSDLSLAWANSKALTSRFKDIKEYINTPEGRGSYIRRAKALSDKYKNHPYIYGWELWNEMDAVGNVVEVIDFTSYMLDSIKALFPNTLVTQTLGSLHSETADKTYSELAKIQSNDFLSIHRYLDEGDEWGQYDKVKGPVDMLTSDAAYFGYNLTKNNFMPIIINEIGAVEPSHSGPFRYYKKDKEGILIHDMIFAPFFSGSAGSGSMWHWNSYIYPQDLWRHFKRFHNVIENIDPIKEMFTPFYFERENVRCYALKGKNKTMIWCRDGLSDWRTELELGISVQIRKNFSLILSDLESTNFSTASIYDPWNNIWINDINIKDNKITIPSFMRSVVIILE